MNCFVEQKINYIDALYAQKEVSIDFSKVDEIKIF